MERVHMKGGYKWVRWSMTQYKFCRQMKIIAWSTTRSRGTQQDHIIPPLHRSSAWKLIVCIRSEFSMLDMPKHVNLLYITHWIFTHNNLMNAIPLLLQKHTKDWVHIHTCCFDTSSGLAQLKRKRMNNEIKINSKHL